MKQNKDKVKVDEKNIRVLEPIEDALSAFVGIDICSINDNYIESLEYSANKRKDSDLQTTDLLTMTPYDKLYTSKNVLQNIMETQTQEPSDTIIGTVTDPSVLLQLHLMLLGSLY
ncbi:unnamed protein product [Euphydryas editha]|uniref:Uncharacterized protein n=1 Tax=Euphydryas editha TaxID=104508 RepID=A0AAU9U134_EUPED|nr:unnamed protein product [Euphydryas editha]